MEISLAAAPVTCNSNLQRTPGAQRVLDGGGVPERTSAYAGNVRVSVSVAVLVICSCQDHSGIVEHGLTLALTRLSLIFYHTPPQSPIDSARRGQASTIGTDRPHTSELSGRTPSFLSP